MEAVKHSLLCVWFIICDWNTHLASLNTRPNFLEYLSVHWLLIVASTPRFKSNHPFPQFCFYSDVHLIAKKTAFSNPINKKQPESFHSCRLNLLKSGPQILESISKTFHICLFISPCHHKHSVIWVLLFSCMVSWIHKLVTLGEDNMW